MATTEDKMTDTQRLEWIMGRMYRLENERYMENGEKRQEWHMTEFSIPRGAVAVDDFMRDMRTVIDKAAAA